MIVKINNTMFDNVTWAVDEGGRGILTLKTENSIPSLLEIIGENNNIEVYNDEDVLLATWYNSGVYAITTVGGTHTRTVEITFDVSILSGNDKEELQGGIDETVDAAIELADIVAELSSTSDKHDEDIKNAKEEIVDIKEDITNIHNAINAIPNDIPLQLSNIWDFYNILADRVAALENK